MGKHIMPKIEIFFFYYCYYLLAKSKKLRTKPWNLIAVIILNWVENKNVHE